MLNRIYTIIDANIMIVLSMFLLLALIIGQVNLITGILVYCMWFVFGFISFQKGYEQKVDEEMTRYYKEKVNQEFNKINNEISNN